MPPKSKECFLSPKDKKRNKKHQHLKQQQNSSALQIQVISLIEKK
jgi:hypothetical protein